MVVVVLSETAGAAVSGAAGGASAAGSSLEHPTASPNTITATETFNAFMLIVISKIEEGEIQRSRPSLDSQRALKRSLEFISHYCISAGAPSRKALHLASDSDCAQVQEKGFTPA